MKNHCDVERKTATQKYNTFNTARHLYAQFGLKVHQSYDQLIQSTFGTSEQINAPIVCILLTGPNVGMNEYLDNELSVPIPVHSCCGVPKGQVYNILVE